MKINPEMQPDPFAEAAASGTVVPDQSLKDVRVLYVCFADSPHSQGWMSLVQGSGAKARVFAHQFGSASLYPPLPWPLFTYSLRRPLGRSKVASSGGVGWRLPNLRGTGGLEGGIVARLSLEVSYLRHIINSWKPHIVHTLSILPAGEMTWRALSGLPAGRRPRWVVSSWGSDINLLRYDEKHLQEIQTVLRECDGFIGDCCRDIRQAVELGLQESKVAVQAALPVTGGIDEKEMPPPLASLDGRRSIVIPKTYEGVANKIMPVLEALRLAEDALEGYDIHFLMGSRDIKMWFAQLPEPIRGRSHWHGSVPKEEFLRMLSQARVVVAPSISDGTPNVLLEAMAAGALPLMSPISSIQEWIEDGRNGLLAHALYPDQIAAALRRALADDDLVRRAALINRQVIIERANRDVIRAQVLAYYKSLTA